MNKILYILIALLTSDCDSFAQKVDIDNLKGNVKELKQYTIVESSSNLIKDSLLLFCKYDGKGTRIEDKIGNESRKCNVKYDEKGNLVEYCRYKFNDVLVFKVTYKYDNKGNIIEWKRYDSDEKLEKKGTYKYDEKSNEIERCIYDFNQVLKARYTHRYDRKGYLKKWGMYNTNGELVWEYTYKRNSKGKIKGCTCKSGGELEWKDKYTYYTKSRMYKICRYDYCRKLVEETVHKFNEVEKNIYDSEKNVIAKKEITKYDNQGNEIERCVYDSDGHLLEKYTHKYDDRGNEIEYVKSKGDNGIFICGTIVEYVYYD
ncbi:MAG: hypothetical protein MJZ33_13180 [Paludibacteraceae bacterium]|nr:hypothetical protein [Paludibacteraceae bacterium]